MTTIAQTGSPFMSRRLSVVAGIFLSLILAASAEAPSPETMKVARSLVTTMKLGDQYKALLPAILLQLLSNRLTIEGLYLVHFVDGEIGS